MGDIVGDIFGGGGGGGGAAQAAPASQTVTQTAELPEWARGYAKDALAKGQALTDISQNPYQSYGGQRIADFGALQKQAFAQAGPQGFGTTVGQYMSPYMQNVVDTQKREAARQSGIAGAQQAGQATMAGAFGGGRDAILRAERERNLMTQLGDIQQQGSQAAFDRATQQYNTGLGQLNTFGALQQAQAQRGLDIPYQEFLNQQNYPYKQLGFMSDLIRGLPLGQTSSKSLYEAAPSGAQQLASLGLGAYGLSKMMAAGGGLMESYADGGSVDAPDNVSRIVSKLSDQQLQQAAQAAQARGDMDQLEAIQSELAMRASERRGLAGAVTPQMAEGFAGGGILAFAGDEEDNDPVSGQLITGSPNRAALQEWMEAQKALKEYKPAPAMTKAERAAMDQENFERFQKFAGEDPYGPMAKRLEGYEADRVKSYEEGKGLAALQAIPAMLQGRGIRGIGAGLGALGGNMAQLSKADAAEKRALGSMQFNLADAQRKERMGLTRDAIASTTEAQKDKIAADKAALDALRARAKGATDAGRAFRTTGGAGGAGKTPKIAEQNYINILADLRATSKPKEGESPQAFEARIAREASKIAVAESKTSDFGPGRAGAAADAIAVKLKAAETDALEKLSRNPDYREATPAMRQSMEDKVRADAQRRVYFEESQGGTIKPIKLD